MYGPDFLKEVERIKNSPLAKQLNAKALSDEEMHSGKGTKADMGKPRDSLIDEYFREQLIEVLEFGARKYSVNNWRAGMAWSRPYDALMRHMHAWNKGETHDEETGLSHLAHAAACLMFLSGYEATNTGTDDRWKYDVGVKQ